MVVAAAALVATPIVIAARPAGASGVSAVELATRIRASGGVGWFGRVATSGTLQIPDNSSFTTLAQLLGEDTDLRVWWRGPLDWRVDRLRSTGETDLFRDDSVAVRWVSESQTATITPVSRIRLPDASDVVPAVLARSMLQGFRPAEVARLDSRRVAGIDAAGVRLTPAEPGSTLAHVDIWADPGTGVPVRVELYGVSDDRPVLTSAVTELTTGTPPSSATRFDPSADVRVQYDQSVDVAATANAFSPVDLPATLAGLRSRDGSDPGAVGIYGRGATTVLVLPVRGSVAFPLREQLQKGAATVDSDTGTYSPVGPVGLFLTPFARTAEGRGQSFLITGTVDAATLQRVARELVDRG